MTANRIRADSAVVRMATAVVILFAAPLCLMQWFRWSSAYSGMIGLASEATHLADARRWALLYLGLLVGMEFLAVLLFAMWLQVRMFASRTVSVFARITIAVAFAIAGTGAAAAVVTWVLKRLA